MTTRLEQAGDARGPAPRHGRDDAAYRFRAPIDVRFRDLDAFGHVNNAVYFTYLEIARAAYVAAVLGHPRGADDVGVVVAEASCRYRSPAFYGERLVAEVATVGLRSRSFEMRYRITVEATGRVVAEAATVLVAFDHRAKRTATLDPAFVRAVERFEGRPLTKSKVGSRKSKEGSEPSAHDSRLTTHDSQPPTIDYRLSTID